jgi:hypothetical protein
MFLTIDHIEVKVKGKKKLQEEGSSFLSTGETKGYKATP